MGSTQKPMRRRFEVQPGGGTLQGIHALGQASHKRGGSRGGFREVDLGGVECVGLASLESLVGGARAERIGWVSTCFHHGFQQFLGLRSSSMGLPPPLPTSAMTEHARMWLPIGLAGTRAPPVLSRPAPQVPAALSFARFGHRSCLEEIRRHRCCMCQPPPACLP